MASISLTLATWILAVLSSPPSPDTVDRVVDQPTPPVTSTRHRYRLRPLGIAGLIVAAEGLGTDFLSSLRLISSSSGDPAYHYIDLTTIPLGGA